MKLNIWDNEKKQYKSFWTNFCRDLENRITNDKFDEVDYISYYFRKLEEEIIPYNGIFLKGQHHVEFEREEDLTWFLIRWS